jgi:hypothetical protein
MTAASDEHCITGGDYQLCSVDHPQLSVSRYKADSRNFEENPAVAPRP